MFSRKTILNACLGISDSHLYTSKITGSPGLKETNVILFNTGWKKASLQCGVFVHPPETFWFGIFLSEYSDEPIQDHVGYNSD